MRKKWVPLLGALGLTFLYPFHAPVFGANAGVREEIRLIAGEASTTDYHPRITAVRNLGLQLQPPEVERLIAFLHKKADQDAIQLAELNAVKNDLVVQLLRQGRPPQELSRRLRDGFRDASMDPVWRDYCLQHLVRAHRIADTDGDREETLVVLREAAAMTESTFAGTALLALRQIAKHVPESVDEENLAAQAFAVAQDPAMPTPSRIAALQVAAPHPGALPFARELAQDSATDMMLRMSAIAVLGTSSDPDDMNILRTFSSNSDIRLRNSARAALRLSGS